MLCRENYQMLVERLLLIVLSLTFLSSAPSVTSQRGSSFPPLVSIGTRTGARANYFPMYEDQHDNLAWQVHIWASKN